MNLAVFRGDPFPGILFQPRLEPWYAWHKRFGKLPESYRDKSLLEFVDDLGVSMRYVHYETGMPDPVEVRWSEKVKMRHERVGDRMFRTTETPLGELHEEQRYTIDQTWRTVGFAAKGREDLKKLAWLMRNASFHFNPEKFETGAEFIGERGEPSFWVPKSPYQALAQIWMGYEDFIEAIYDFPVEVKEAMRAIDEAYEPLYAEIAEYGKVRVINFGENLHGELLTPRFVENYLMPFYERRAGQLRKAGIFSHMHLDGHVRPLLRYLKAFPFDGIEALTPRPQGDVDLEEIRDALGEKVLLDGIPAALFLPHHKPEELEECVGKIIAYFSPRLILGISDELPQGAGPEALERVRWVARCCASRTPRK